MKRSAHFLILLVFPLMFSGAACGEDFDMSLMEKADNLRDVDISVLEKGSQVIAGNYPVSLVINDEPAGEITQPFLLIDGAVQPVFSAQRLKSWGITPGRAPAGQHPLSTFIDETTVSYDAGIEQLLLTVPQARYHPIAGDIAPEENWDHGLNAARFNYNLNLQRSSGSQQQNTASSTLNNGINLGNWRLRNDGYFTYTHGEKSHYQSSASYVTRDIATLKSTFRGGDFFTDGKIFSSVSLRGVTLFSSEAMRPDNQRFYLPVISGNARTNATVVIRQNGFVIDQRRVTPGPFLIKDVQSASTSGDLDISIQETDGSVRHFTQAFNAIAALLPPGVFNYELSGGRYRNSSTDSALTPGIYQASAYYGLNNTFTLLGGQQMSVQDAFRYHNSGGGLAVNMPWLGGMSVLLKRSSDQHSSHSHHGQQLEALFSRTLRETDSTLSLSWKHKYNPHYREVSEAISAAEHSQATTAYRDQYNLQLDQSLGDLTLLVRYSEDITWKNTRQRSSRLGLSLNKWQSQFQVYFSHQQDTQGVAENSLTLNIEVPLGNDQRHHVGFASQYDSRGGRQQAASLGGSLMADNQLTYDINVSDQNAQQALNASGSYSGSGGVASAGLAQGRGYQQTSLGLQGGILIHHHGVTLSQPLGDTVVLVHTPHTGGLKLENSQNVYTDRWGNAVIPYAVAYRVNDVELDPDSLDRQIDAPSTVKKVIPTQGAIIEADFNARRHDRRFARITDRQHHPLPFGVDVQDASSVALGNGGAAGILLADFSHARWPLTVSLNGHVLCHIPRSDNAGPSSDSSTLWKLSCV